MSAHHEAEVEEQLVVLLERMRRERLEDDWEEEFIHYHEDDTPLHDGMIRSQDEPLTTEPANSVPLDDCPDDCVAQG